MISINWKPSSHTIADLRDWNDSNLLGLSPDYQRREVWTDAAKIYLIDTILRNIPIPKIFISTTIKNGKSYRRVIDGQQRIRAILAFLKNDFALRKPFSDEDYKNKFYKELPEEAQNRILTYLIDFNEIYNTTEEIERDIYLRVNKYTKILNKQELRRADFPGDFLKLSQDLSMEPFFKEANVFSYSSVRRMLDVEFVSELLAVQFEGVADKKDNLEHCYETYIQIDKDKQISIKKEFTQVFSEIRKIFNEDLNKFSKTRFKQKADLYSLFCAILELNRAGLFIQEKNCENLLMDLMLLDEHIAPQSSIALLSEYAIKCTSQANSNSSRIYRRDRIIHFLKGTYSSELPSKEKMEYFIKIKTDLYELNHNEVIKDNAPFRLEWDARASEFQLVNSILIDKDGNRYV